MDENKVIEISKEEAVDYLKKCLYYIKKNDVVTFTKKSTNILQMSINALEEQIKKENNTFKKSSNINRLEVINKFIKLKENAEYQVEQTEKVFPFMKSNFRKDVILYEAAISALVEQEQREKNEPLTFEELLAKENKPVWVEHCHGGEWVVVCWDYVDRIAYSRNACLHKHDYGKEWIAYNYEITKEERWKRWK